MKPILLFFCLIPFMASGQTVKKGALPPDSLLRMTEQAFETYTTQRLVDSTLFAVALRRIQCGRGVSAPTLNHLLSENWAWDIQDLYKPMYDTLFIWKETPKALLTPVLVTLLRKFPLQKSDTLFRNQLLERVYEARRYVYTQYLAVQQLNYLTGEYLYYQGMYDRGDNFLLDTFNPIFYHVGITHDVSFEISSPMYDLQEKSFWKLAESWSRRKDTEKMSMLRDWPKFGSFRIKNYEAVQKFNKYLIKAGLEPIKN